MSHKQNEMFYTDVVHVYCGLAGAAIGWYEGQRQQVTYYAQHRIFRKTTDFIEQLNIYIESTSF